jgi:hypothetical protein
MRNLPVKLWIRQTSAKWTDRSVVSGGIPSLATDGYVLAPPASWPVRTVCTMGALPSKLRQRKKSRSSVPSSKGPPSRRARCKWEGRSAAPAVHA